MARFVIDSSIDRVLRTGADRREALYRNFDARGADGLASIARRGGASGLVLNEVLPAQRCPRSPAFSL